MVGGVCCGDGRRVVLDSRGGENLAPPRRIERVHFVGRTGQGTDLTGAPEAPERSKGEGPPAGRPLFFVLRGLGIDEIHGDGLDAEFLDIGEASDGAGRVIVVCGAGITRIASANIFMEGCEDLGCLEGRHIEEAAPYLGGGEAASCETCDNAEVVGSTFEGAPEIGIG